MSRVYVGRISSRTREGDLEEIFGKYGKVVSCDVKRDYAFVDFEDPRDAGLSLNAFLGGAIWTEYKHELH